MKTFAQYLLENNDFNDKRQELNQVLSSLERVEDEVVDAGWVKLLDILSKPYGMVYKSQQSVEYTDEALELAKALQTAYDRKDYSLLQFYLTKYVNPQKV